MRAQRDQRLEKKMAAAVHHNKTLVKSFVSRVALWWKVSWDSKTTRTVPH